MDPTLLLTLGIILAATLVGSALRGLHRDRCLRDFDGYPVTVLGKDEDVRWGTLRLQSTGFELEYAADVLDTQMHIETSYLIYKSEYGEVDGLCRFLDDLSPKDRERRDQALERAFHPGPMQCLVRQMRNFVNTAIDSLNEALAILLGRARPLAGQLPVTSQTHLKGLTKNILGYMGTSYDPLLERLVGVQAVIEVQHDAGIHEFVGVLCDYSPDFIELLDVYFPRRIRLEVTAAAAGDGDAGGQAPRFAGPGAMTVPVTEDDAVRRGGLCARLASGLLTVENGTGRTVRLDVITEGENLFAEQVVVPENGVWRIEMPGESGSARVEARIVQRLDMILPRATSLIRHRAERYETWDAFVRAFRFNEPEMRDLMAQRIGTPNPSVDYQALLLNRSQVFPSDEWLSDALDRRERIEECVSEVAESVPCHQQRERGEKASMRGKARSKG
jgi:hypothetical protein